MKRLLIPLFFFLLATSTALPGKPHTLPTNDNTSAFNVMKNNGTSVFKVVRNGMIAVMAAN